MILLDTHALVWLDEGNLLLGTNTRQLIEETFQQGTIAVASISFLEVAMLMEKQRLNISMQMEQWRTELLASGITEIPLSGAIGIQAAQLPGFHGDPADRMITATALQTGSTLITADQKILSYSNSLKRRDARL